LSYSGHIQSYLRWLIFIAISGILIGVSSAFLLASLNWAGDFRARSAYLVWGLPFAGYLVGYVFRRYGKNTDRGYNLVLEEAQNPQKQIPWRMAPLVWFGTFATHLFGGSAGREGTAIQMGSAISDGLFHFFRLDQKNRRLFLIAAMGASFGSAIGAPWAGLIFGMEVLGFANIQPLAIVECLIMTLFSFLTTNFLRAPHTEYHQVGVDSFFDFKILLMVLVAGVLFGLTARIFVWLRDKVQALMKKHFVDAAKRAAVGGLVLAILFSQSLLAPYMGLGLEQIQKSLSSTASFQEPLLKLLLTALTLGSGFKGGEFTPLVFIGSSLGSALSIVLPVSASLLAAIGFVAVFAGAANTPLACTVMAMELFGPGVGFYALAACFASCYFSGRHF
jgi:H+/Cl- antiporter ClcA